MKEYILALIAPIVTLIYSLITPYLFGTNGYIEYVSKMIENERYQNTIFVKNMRKNEYLKKIDFVVSSEIKIDDLIVNDNKTDAINNTIAIFDILPQDVSIISFITNKKLNNNNLHVVKNNQTIDISYFNNIGNVNIKIFIIVLIYALINIIFAYLSKRRMNNYKLEYEKIMNNQEEKIVDLESKMAAIIKEEKTIKAVNIKEMSDFERELEFYKSVILKICNKNMTKNELENEISKSLKTFSKKKFKYLNYNDVYNIIGELMGSYEDSNVNQYDKKMKI